MGSAGPAIKAAVVNVLKTLYPAPTLTSYGDPGVYQPNEIVAVMGMKMQISLPVGSTARTREETTEVEVVFSVFASGGDPAQRAATERAFALLAPFTDYFKTKPNETLSGACRNAWVSSYNLVETNAQDPASGANTGQVAEITAVVTAHTRI